MTRKIKSVILLFILLLGAVSHTSHVYAQGAPAAAPPPAIRPASITPTILGGDPLSILSGSIGGILGGVNTGLGSFTSSILGGIGLGGAGGGFLGSIATGVTGNVLGSVLTGTLGQVIVNGESLGDALGTTAQLVGSSILTGNHSLDRIIGQAARGDNAEEVLERAAEGALRELSTGDARTDRFIRQIGGIFGNFGLRARLGCERYSDDGSRRSTVGDIMCNAVYSTALVPGLFAGLSYLFGLYFGFIAILKLKDHVDNPNRTEIWDPMKRAIVAGSFLAIPTVLQAAYNTVAFGLSGHRIVFYGFNVDPSVVEGAGLDALFINFIQDIWKPVGFLLPAFAYLAGIVLIMIAISRLLKSEQEGARGPTGIGTIMTLLVGGACLSYNKIVGAFSASLLGTTQVKTFAILTYGDVEDPAIIHSEAVFSAITAFVMIIGMVSILRGLFMLRSVAEGSQQASMMAAITHMVGGSLAVNIGPVVNAVNNSLGLDAGGPNPAFLWFT